jgi:hypothetical protein
MLPVLKYKKGQGPRLPFTALPPLMPSKTDGCSFSENGFTGIHQLPETLGLSKYEGGKKAADRVGRRRKRLSRLEINLSVVLGR